MKAKNTGNLKRNLFLVHTEYHLLLALKIIYEKFNNVNWNNEILITKLENRFSSLFEVSRLNEVYDNIRFEIHSGPMNKLLFKQLIKEDTHNFFYYQPTQIWNNLIASNLKSKRNTTINLVQDGYAVYVKFQKSHEFVSMIIDTFKDYKKVFLEQAIPNKFLISKYYRHGNQWYIDNLWLTNPECFDAIHNQSKAKLEAIIEFDASSISYCVNAFDFNLNIPSDGILFYVSQPLWTERMRNAELEFLRSFEKLYKRTLFIKLHPINKLDGASRYSSLKNIQIINNNVPAEFYLLSLRNSIVLSCWSTALITNNVFCKYYFTYPIFKKLDAKALNQSDMAIMPHIKLVSDPMQIIEKHRTE